MKAFVMALLFTLVTVATIGTACGEGGSELTTDEFLQEVVVLAEEAEERSAGLEAAAALSPGTTDQTAELLREFTAITQEFTARLEKLNAPKEVLELQQELSSAGEEFVPLFEDAIDQAAAAGSADAFLSLFDDVAVEAALERYQQACIDLELFAASNSVDVDLACDEF